MSKFAVLIARTTVRCKQLDLINFPIQQLSCISMVFKCISPCTSPIHCQKGKIKILPPCGTSSFQALWGCLLLHVGLQISRVQHDSIICFMPVKSLLHSTVGDCYKWGMAGRSAVLQPSRWLFLRQEGGKNATATPKKHVRSSAVLVFSGWMVLELWSDQSTTTWDGFSGWAPVQDQGFSPGFAMFKQSFEFATLKTRFSGNMENETDQECLESGHWMPPISWIYSSWKWFPYQELGFFRKMGVPP